jgi:division protein CdvB (Snf7/Vps24/ESCRT-III family)
VTSFQNKWSKPQTQGLGERLNDALKPKGALKPRVETAIKRLQLQIGKLDNMLSKLKQRDEQLFQRVVAATQQHDTPTSKVLSNELAEIRKVSRILGNARIALEQIELRLTTFHNLGDTVVTIMPTIGLMKSLKSSLIKFMPGADQELNRMTEMLSGLMTETFQGSDASFGVDETTNSESEKILQEAAAVAEASINEKFPSMPIQSSSSISSSTRFT